MNMMKHKYGLPLSKLNSGQSLYYRSNYKQKLNIYSDHLCWFIAKQFYHSHLQVSFVQVTLISFITVHKCLK